MWWYPHEPAGEGREEAVHAATRERIESGWTRIDAHLAQHGPYLLGDWPCAADFYLTMLMRWSRPMPRPATAWTHRDAMAGRMRDWHSLRQVSTRARPAE